MKTYPLLLALFAMLFSRCGTMKVYSDFDRDLSVRNYSTFGWPDNKQLEIKNDPLYYNELNDKRIKNEVGAQVKNKGYLFEADHPELKMHYHIVLENRTAIYPDPLGSNYGPYWMNRNANSREYREGTLIIDFMDAKTNNLVWRGWAVNFLDEDRPDQIEDQIRNAVVKIFEKFPTH